MEWHVIYLNYNPNGKNPGYIYAAKQHFVKVLFKYMRKCDSDAVCGSLVSAAYKTAAGNQLELCEAFIRKYSRPNTVLMFSSLSDIAPRAESALAGMRRWEENPNISSIYICNFSCRQPVASYAEALYALYGARFGDSVRKRSPSLPERVVDVAASLRMQYEPVAYADIEKYCGIGCEALIQKLRANGPLPTARGREINESEIEEVQQVWEDYYKAIGIYDRVFYDDLSPSDVS